VLLFFTVFGYFDEAENAATLAALTRLLAPGGFLMLDLPDAERLELVPHSRRRLPDGSLVEEHRRRVGARLEKTVRCADGATVVESVRLYGRDELHALAAGVGCECRIDAWRDRWWVRLDQLSSPAAPAADRSSHRHC
jgi:hypothetical protein